LFDDFPAVSALDQRSYSRADRRDTVDPFAEAFSRDGAVGGVAEPASPPSGCVFRTRCPHTVAGCAESIPVLWEIAPGCRVACLRDDVVVQGA
jgi:oligopeptide/dipeptide ABC transporter ATP-binding protein